MGTRGQGELELGWDYDRMGGWGWGDGDGGAVRHGPHLPVVTAQDPAALEGNRNGAAVPMGAPKSPED